MLLCWQARGRRRTRAGTAAGKLSAMQCEHVQRWWWWWCGVGWGGGEGGLGGLACLEGHGRVETHQRGKKLAL